MRKFTLLVLLLIFSCAPKQEDVSKSQWQYFYDLGMSSYIAKNYSEAIANFFRASQLAPNEPKVWNALGLAYMEVEEYQKAESAFLRALQVDKTYTEAKLNLGVLYYRQKDYERAIRVLREVIEDEAFPQKHMAFYSLAKVYQAIDEKGDYLANLRRAVAYNPMFIDAQLELARFYEEERDFASARDVYQRLVNNGIANPFIYLGLARAEYELGNYSLAKDYIRRVIEDKQASNQLRSQAYELLSLVLIAEQGKLNTQRPAEIPGLTIIQEVQPRQQETLEEYKAKTDTQLDDENAKHPQQNGRYYRIQLGAFSFVSSAKAWKERLEKELNLKDVVVVESSGLFKVFYGKFESREDAIKELNRLRALNLYGFIVYE